MTDVVVIGAGAAGLMCAIVAGRRGKSVVVLERGERIGAKILISGGGRCNFTNLHARPENYLSANPDFCKSALARYMPHDFLALVERHGVAWHEKKLGQLFCDGSSREIVEMLRKECAGAGVEIKTGADVTAIRRVEPDGNFEVVTLRETFFAKRLVIATGGLSLPKLGATDFAYRIARQFGLAVLPVRAGLVPFTFGGGDLEFCRTLSGVSVPCTARIEKEKERSVEFTEHFLFTHRGLSGPAILQVSSYWQAPAELRINLFPGNGARAWLEENRASAMRLDTLLARRLPERFATAWAASLAPLRPVRSYSSRELDGIAHRIENWKLRPAGTEGYATAEVTVGGIDTRDLHSKTMEARKVPGLHFIGEALDVTGWLGGYNFQWAWASGHACGQAI
ncbi:MAG TPA: NAD(P)/FAD-dependent oxidoreductase [Candidatus Methylacidiphilales bacterium]|jgi:predicted Rossmann fold flavoprotein|nr:NAD(P)/FAD-dependent oxidoreductase [Candidatus Methylacidiphilales bacterium]